MTKTNFSSTSFFILAVVFGSGFVGSQSANAQFTIVSPKQFADVEAADVVDLSDFASYRLQQVYSADDFASLGPGPFQISRIDWRPDGEVTEPMTYSSPDWLIKMSTTQTDPAELSATFAENIGPDEIVVVDGAVTMSTDNLGPAGGPKFFDYGVDFETPFTFDPSQGNLLMDLTVIDASGPLLLDFSFAPTESTNFHWTGTHGPNSPMAATTPETVGGPLGGHVVQFTVVPEPQRSPFFWDEFDRVDLFDSEIKYIRDDTPEEEYEIVDGSLIVNSLADAFPAVRVDVSGEMDDFVLKAQGRILNNPNCQWAWLGMYGRGTESGSFNFNDAHAPIYWAGFATDGNVSMGKTIDRNNDANVFLGQERKYSCQQVTENDVHMELRIVGDEIEFTSWLDGTAKPDSPDLTASDDSITLNDFLGVFINPNQLEDFALRYLAVLPAVDGDFDASGELDANDIDVLSAEVQSATKNRALDLNGDENVNKEDRLVLISELMNTWIGDSNLDGEFNSADFVNVFQAGQYEDALIGNSTWATGDWNGDSEFTSADFVVVFQEAGYEKGPRNIRVAKVPEPDLFTVLMLISLRFIHLARRKEFTRVGHFE